eukprot:Sspe_Gene.25996::Locus_10605_Transcript_5_5_Confidence_0.643_Length_613::g.25996::m.25996
MSPARRQVVCWHRSRGVTFPIKESWKDRKHAFHPKISSKLPRPDSDDDDLDLCGSDSGDSSGADLSGAEENPFNGALRGKHQWKLTAERRLAESAQKAALKAKQALKQPQK